MKKVTLALLMLVLGAPQGYAQVAGQNWLRDSHWDDATKAPELWNSPAWVLDLVRDKQFDKKYRFVARLNPFYLRGDFNGDGQPDFAVLIQRLSDNKQGIAVFHYGENAIRVIGGGKSFGYGGDDFRWMDVWQVYPKGEVERGVGEGPPPKLQGEALLVEKSESASALIYFDGQEYIWYHQGD